MTSARVVSGRSFFVLYIAMPSFELLCEILREQTGLVTGSASPRPEGVPALPRGAEAMDLHARAIHVPIRAWPRDTLNIPSTIKRLREGWWINGTRRGAICGGWVTTICRQVTICRQGVVKIIDHVGVASTPPYESSYNGYFLGNLGWTDHRGLR
jgi:hypothetical protein